MRPTRRVRASAPPRPCAGIGAGVVRAWLMSMAVPPVAVVPKERRPREAGVLDGRGASPAHIVCSSSCLSSWKRSAESSTAAVLPIVLPPMLDAELLDRDLAGLVLDRNRAVAGVFVDLARDDVDQRRPVLVAVPRHDAARLHDELAQAQAAVGERDLLLAELDHAEHVVGHVLRLHLARRANAGLGLVGRALAGARRRGEKGEACGEGRASEAAAKLLHCHGIDHGPGLLSGPIRGAGHGEQDHEMRAAL